MPSLLELVEEAGRQFTVCNACRYCEGYCAVFPAMERRSIFTEGDVAYLANLCHDCRACFQACMYTPPHEFAVNIPSAMAAVRVQTYERYTWPRWLGGLFEHSIAANVTMSIVGAVLALLAIAGSGHLGGLFKVHSGPGSFYEVVPFEVMAAAGTLVSAYVVAVMLGGFVFFWRAAGGGLRELADWTAWSGALGEVATLRYQAGGGAGCYYPDSQRPSNARRLLHQMVAYGFLAAFIATVLAAIAQDLMGILPPYSLLSPPVLFGSFGGVLMVVGCTGLIWLKVRSDLVLGTQDMRSLDFAFLVVLDLVSVTGMLLLGLRDTPLLGSMLTAHLAFLVALYATTPYGKFVHVVYRFAALLLNRVEANREKRNLAEARQ